MCGTCHSQRQAQKVQLFQAPTCLNAVYHDSRAHTCTQSSASIHLGQSVAPAQSEWCGLTVSGSQGPRVISMVVGQIRQSLDRPLQIHKDWYLTIIDLEDCFFDIPLHPDDAPCFAFSVSSINREAPLQRFHWVLSPQSSPTICQWFVAKILTLVHKVYSQVLILHYMDDILLAAKDATTLDTTVKDASQQSKRLD